MKTEKRNFIEASTTRPKRFKRTRLLGKMSPVGTALFVAAITVTAVLGGFFYSYMTVQISGDVDISGRTITSVFKWDGVDIVGDSIDVPLDITEISNGEYFVYSHNCSNEDMGNWLVSCDLSSLEEIMTDPLNAFYGFRLDCTPSVFVIGPGTHQDILFNYSANHEMMDPTLYGSLDGILPVSIDVNIEILTPPVIVNDTCTLEYGIPFTLDVLANDLHQTGNTLTITSTNNNGNTIDISIVANKLRLVNNHGSIGTTDLTITYTIVDLAGVIDTGSVLCHCHWAG